MLRKVNIKFSKWTCDCPNYVMFPMLEIQMIVQKHFIRQWPAIMSYIYYFNVRGLFIVL